MNYYQYDPEANRFNGYAVAQSEDEDGVLSIHFDDGGLPSNAVKLRGFMDNPGEDGDFPSLTNFRRIPIVSQRAWDFLLPLIGNYVDPIPVKLPTEDPFYFLHVKVIIDCVDLDRSELVRYSDGSVMKVVKFHFRHDAIGDIHIFKTPKSAGSDLLVDDVFRNIVECNDLKGLRFVEVPTV